MSNQIGFAVAMATEGNFGFWYLAAGQISQDYLFSFPQTFILWCKPIKCYTVFLCMHLHWMTFSLYQGHGMQKWVMMQSMEQLVCGVEPHSIKMIIFFSKHEYVPKLMTFPAQGQGHIGKVCFVARIRATFLNALFQRKNVVMNALHFTSPGMFRKDDLHQRSRSA